MIRAVLSVLLALLIIMTVFQPFNSHVQLLIMIGIAIFVAFLMFKMAYMEEKDN